MSTVIRRGVSPQEQAMRDNAIANSQKNADLIEYLAMMTDVDIPTDETEVNDNE